MDEEREHRKAVGWARIPMALLLVLAVTLGSAPASALVATLESGTVTSPTTTTSKSLSDPEPPEPPGPGEEPWCLNVQVLSFTATPSTITFDGSATLFWDVRVPYGCYTGLQINGAAVPLQGSLTVQPPHSAVFYYRMRATLPGRVRDVATTTVTVNPLAEPPPGQHQTITITSNHPQRLIQALGTRNTTVILASHVQVDVSNQHDIIIRDGVELYGDRVRLNPGPIIYTLTRPEVLFKVVGSGEGRSDEPVNYNLAPVRVRIAGVRIKGPDMGSVEGDTTKTYGIWIDSCQSLGAAPLDVEIYNNEIYGWNGAAIRMLDECHRMAPSPEPSPTLHAVRIHDNYIHHNQHIGGEGYGIVVSLGGYALIERNVFDWNRHSITGDGSPGAGYAAYRNLVLKNGGYHNTYLFVDYYTHQFDMHGTDNCGIESVPLVGSDHVWNCGAAGHSMYIRHNTFLNTRGVAIKLRGTPEVGMYVGDNVFAHFFLWNGILPSALDQTETGLQVEAGNVLGVDGSTELGSCDFDGDGIYDSFMATGATWWYSSGGTTPWVYLNTSTKHLSELTLGDVDGDGVCDVAADGFFSSGGTGPWARVRRVPLPFVPRGGMLLQ